MGMRIGLLLGGHVSSRVSMNVEGLCDVVEREGDGRAGGTDLVLAFSPLFHIPVGSEAEIALGPKVGFRRLEHDFEFSSKIGGATYRESTVYLLTGRVIGFNFGIFGRLAPTTRAGVFFGFDVRTLGTPTTCTTVSWRGTSTETCDAWQGSTPSTSRVAALSLGLLF